MFEENQNPSLKKLEVECLELNDFVGKFVFHNLQVGDGHTIGNSLRRVLLNDLRGISIVGARISKIRHEFGTIPGVREDILDILLNLQKLVFASSEENGSIGRLKIQGPTMVTAACLEFSSEIKIINPFQYITTITDDSFLELEVYLEWGKGTVREANENSLGFKPSDAIDYLKVTPLFTPIREVEYFVTTIGNQEELTLEIKTNGSLTPFEALSKASETLIRWFTTIQSFDISLSQSEAAKKKEKNKKSNKKVDLSSIPIEELNLSRRAYNGLKRAEIHLVGDLIGCTLNEIRSIKNFGEKSLQEVIQVLQLRYGVFIDNSESK